MRKEKRGLSMSEITLRTFRDINAKKPILVMGFPGTGLVGSIAASHLVDTLKLEFVGYITSPDFAPLAAIHNYTPMPAVRIHYSPKHNIVVILSEMTIPVALSLQLAEKIHAFSKSLGVSSIISLGGISLKETPNQVYAIATDQKLIQPLLSKKIAKPIRDGATTGVSGILLSMGSVEKFQVLSLLAESAEEYVDPSAASNILNVLSSMLNVKIDTSRLDEEAEELIVEMREKILKSKPPMKTVTEEGGMYG